MKYCPLMSYAKQYCTEISCFEEECAFAADGAGECLVKQALQLYVAKERTRIAEEAEKSRRETEMALNHWEYMKNNNLRKAKDIIEDLSPCIDQVIDSI